jgi:hypothetical protein
MKFIEHENIQAFGLRVNDHGKWYAEMKILIAEDMPFVCIQDMVENKISWRESFLGIPMGIMGIRAFRKIFRGMQFGVGAGAGRSVRVILLNRPGSKHKEK